MSAVKFSSCIPKNHFVHPSCKVPALHLGSLFSEKNRERPYFLIGSMKLELHQESRLYTCFPL